MKANVPNLSDLYPWDGVRNLRLFSALQESRCCWSVLMIHIPILRAGKPYYSLEYSQRSNILKPEKMLHLSVKRIRG